VTITTTTTTTTIIHHHHYCHAGSYNIYAEAV
jgi:hypothetical protein